MLSHATVRRTAALAAAVLVASGTVVVSSAVPSAAAGEQITLAKTATPAVLPGDPISYSLAASNPGTAPEYNLSLRDELAPGLSYQAGSTTPTSAGEPVVSTVGAGASAHQVLVWQNVSDLQVGGHYTVGFTATPDAASYPAGATLANTGSAYANTDPRATPRFDGSGTVVAGSYTQSATSPAATTSIVPIKVDKSEPSPEGELVRGVHDNTTVYTLTVSNSGQGATTGVTLTDYLPAGLEFLGCGGIDNTSGGAVEYPGAPRLTGTPTVPACVAAATVTTVDSPSVVPPVPAGVYTKVTWTLGNLAAGEVRTVKYRAGVPLQANTMTFTGGTPGGATTQAANLDNNNGPSTRETATAQSATNHAVVAGVYQGTYQGSPTPGSTPVTSSTALTRTLQDLAMTKTVAPGQWKENGIATYTLTLRGSEYVSSSGVVITDVIPDGLCPLDIGVNYNPGDPSCAPSAAYAPTISGSPTGSISFASVVHDTAAGSYTMRFSPVAVAKDGTVVITYQARMRPEYGDGNPTVSGDSYTNNATLTGTTTPVPATGVTGTTTVNDSSQATITSGGASIDKTTLPNTVTPYQCGAAGYGEAADLGAPAVTFHLGDRICFQLRVDFPTGSNLRNPVVSDFLPPGTSYEPGSAQLAPGNTLPGSDVSFNEAAASAGSANPTWTLGHLVGGNRFVNTGSVFVARLAVIVVAPSSTRAVGISGNLMKGRAENTAGVAASLRDVENVGIAPTPDVGITKGVQSVNGGPPVNGPDVDNVQVREGDSVTFRLDITNKGIASNATDVPVYAADVWDVLPAGITCAQVGTISDGGTCNAPGALPASTPGRSVIRWQLPRSATLAPGATRTLTYAMTVPAGTSVSTNFVNTGYVRSFQAATNLGTDVTFYPASNVDTTVPAAQQLAPAASDPSNVFLPDVPVTKSQTTAITETGNNALTQATIGELVTYTVTATVPAHTTVFNARLTDPMPTGLTFVSASAGYSPTGVPPASSPLPAGVTLNAATGQLVWPATYDNTTATDQLFAVTITARVSTIAGNANGTVRTNTVSFTSTTALAGGTSVPARTASSRTTVVVPAPTLAKTSSVATAVAGQTITYTLTAGNPAGRPPSHDTVVIDCVPAGLTFAAYGTSTQGSTAPAVAGDGTNGCAVGATKLTWNVGSVLGGTSPTLTYTAVVSTTSAGAAAYTNTATLTGSTLADGANCTPAPTIERCVTASASRTVTVSPATITKTTSTPTRTIGQAAQFTVTARIPAKVNYYDAAIIDVLPAGLDPTTVTTQSVTCTPGCSVPGTPLAAAPGPGSATRIGWLLGDVLSDPVQRTVTVVYSAVVQDVPTNTRGSALTNGASVRWNLVNGTDPVSAGASFDKSSANAAATVTVVEPHVVLAKSVDDTTPEPGQSFTYTVTASNTGASNLSTAYGVVVVDTVPTGVVVTSVHGGGVLTGAGPNGGGTITWTLAPLAPSTSIDLTYDATLAPSPTLTTAALTNSVDAQYDSLPTGGRHYDDVTPATATVTPAFPFLTPAKTAVTAGPAYIGQPFLWRLTLTNTGAGTAYGVDGADTLPLNWRYTAGSAQVSVNGAPATQTEPAISTDGGGHQVLTWTDLGDLPAGTAVVITITTTPIDSPPDSVVTAPGVGHAVDHTNTLGGSASDKTGATGNSSGPYHGPDATATAHIDSADVVIAKSVSTPFVAGSGGAWSLHVSNAGPDTAVGPFAMTDTLPAGLGFVSAAGTGWSCSYAAVSRQISCARTVATDALASGAAFPDVVVTVAVAADVADGTTYRNTGSVTARTYDPKPGNNNDTSTATVTTSADVQLVKRLSGPLVAGQTATYTLDVTNAGPSLAQAPVRVVDTLPPGSSYLSATGSGWTCTPGGAPGAQTVTCDRAALPVGPAPQIALQVAIPADQTSAVVNTATASSPTTDPKPGNNTDTVTTTPGTSADLVLTKSHVGALVAGTTGTYRFQVQNKGPSDAAGPLTLTDQLPAGVSYSSLTVADGWTCSADAGQLMTCTRPSGLAAGASTTFEVAVAVDSTVTGNIHNSATVTSPTTDPVPGNNTDTDDSTAVTSADLAITKAQNGTVTAGRSVTFTLSVVNNGPSAADSVEVSDVLPAGLTYGATSSATGTGWSCDYTDATRTVDCTRPTLGAGVTAPVITVTVDVDPGAGPATITNTGTVTSATPDPKPGNNTSSVDVTVVDLANLSIVKSRTDSGPVTAGTSTGFTFAVHNDGPSDADSVVVTDALPTGLVPTAAAGTGWHCTIAGQSVTCDRPRVSAGSDAPVITVTADLGPSVPDGTTLTNTAVVATSTPETSTDDNTSSVDVPVRARADLSLAKSHRGGPAAAGGTVTYDLRAHNDGPSDAVAPVRIVDTLPVGLTYVSNAAPWSCSAAAPDPGGQQVTCTLGAGTGIAAEADAPVLTMTVAIASDADPGSYRNDATVTSGTVDPDPSNNDAHDTVSVGTAADLSIVKAHTGTARVGDPLTFTLTVHNDGPSDARDVAVADTLPTGLTYTSATGPGWTCSLTGADLVGCTRPTLASGATSVITLVVGVTAAAYPSAANTATVDAGTPDPDPGNNSSTDPVAVPPLVDLAIVKTHTGTLRVGHPATFSLAVSNAGPTDDPGPVTVTDTLPAGLAYVSASAPGWACTATGQVVTCVAADGLAAGRRTTIALVVDVLAAAYPSIANTATITSPAQDTDPANNSSTDTAPVSPQVSLALAKVLQSYDPTSGQASWLLTVTNLGPNATVGPVVVVDTLQAGLTYAGFHGAGWTCAAVGQVVTCTYDRTIRPGGMAAVEIDTTVKAAGGTVLTNSATISAGGIDDQNPKDDRASASLSVANGGVLPKTGTDVVSYALLAMALLMLGMAFVATGRRRPGS